MNEQELTRRLESMPAPEAPPDLLDRIQAEIPEDLSVLAQPSSRSAVGARWWQVAAMLVVFVGGGWLAWNSVSDPAAPRLEPSSVEHEPSTPAVLDSRVGEQAELEAVRLDDSAEVSPSPDHVFESAPTSIAVQTAAPVEVDALAMKVARREEQVSITATAPAVATSAAQTVAPEMRQERRSAADQGVSGSAQEVGGGVVGGTAGGVSGGVPEGALGGVRGGVVGGVVSRPRVPPPGAPAPPPAAAPSKMRIMSAQENAAAMPSTGGSTEPNDQPYGDVFFESAGVNPFIDTEDDPLSTFGLDVDTGSYSVARRYLTDGNLPPPASIRVEEFLNSFDYGDRPPQRGDFSITAEGGPWPYSRGQRYYGLRFGIQGREVSVAARKPATLIFTIDTSGSMAQQSRLETVKRALEILVEQLGRRDRIGLVTYGSSAQVVLEPTSDHSAILRAIERLRPEGSTNVEDGLLAAYDLAGRYFREGEINRIILCSDGVANVGRTGHESILARIGAAARRGIELTTVGFGMGNYNDVLMEQLADRGNGQYAYVDNLREARRVFEENLTGTLQTIARDAKVQVEFNPHTVASYRLLGYENRDIADHRFRDDRVDAGEIGAGHSVTALYEIKLKPGVRPSDEIATLHLRYKDVDGGDRVIETEKVVKLADLAGRWESASESYRLASLVATFAEVLKRSYWAKEASPSELTRRIESLAEEMGTTKVNELSDLSRAAFRLIPSEDEE